MNNRCATINKILPFSCVDGPGNRLVLFLQGCNLRCLTCHNPYTMALCNHCGDCAVTCPHGALSINDGKVNWQADICQQCDTCLQTCTLNASPMTLRYSVEQILAVMTKHSAFLTGVTVSGGEATQQLPFIIALFKAIKQQPQLKHLTCFIDSNGYLSQTGWLKVMDCMDGAMIDLKAWSVETALSLTGKNNQQVLETIELLVKHNKLYELRLLFIPNVTDYLENIDALSVLLAAFPESVRIKINAFQTHGVKGIAKDWQSAQQQEIEFFAKQLSERGVKNIHLPSVYL